QRRLRYLGQHHSSWRKRRRIELPTHSLARGVIGFEVIRRRPSAALRTHLGPAVLDGPQRFFGLQISRAVPTLGPKRVLKPGSKGRDGEAETERAHAEDGGAADGRGADVRLGQGGPGLRRRGRPKRLED